MADTAFGHPAYVANPTNSKPATPASELIVITCPERCSRMIGVLLAHGDSEA
jgi:hypothetical protein